VKSAYTVAALEAKADHVLAWRAPLEESLPVLAELGYDGVELMVKSPEQFDIAATQAVLDRTGLKIAAIGTGPIAQERALSLSAADDAVRRQAIEAAEAALRLCAVWGACLTIGAFRGRCEPADVPTAKQRLADSLRQLLPLAERQGVRICLEPQNRFQCSFFRTVAETLPFIEQLGSTHLGLSLDTFHMNIEEASLEDACYTARERTFYVQLADNHRGPPGTGLFPFDRFPRLLAQIGYDGWVSMEITQSPDPISAARAAIAGFRRFTSGSMARQTHEPG
jgi:sugar phosphate isomerase/epimerase